MFKRIVSLTVKTSTLIPSIQLTWTKNGNWLGFLTKGFGFQCNYQNIIRAYQNSLVFALSPCSSPTTLQTMRMNQLDWILLV